MVPSPRKRAAPTTTFDTTWNATDATFLDPNALPVAKIPRGWERRQEVKRFGQGKEKKIWRRFNLRSHVHNTAQDDDDADDGDEDEQNARSRAVKRRQHLSPKAMEKTASKLNGKKRAFKGTRWDRRKSVLPRKKAVRIDDPAYTAENEANGDDEEGDSRDVTEFESESFTETNTTAGAQEHPVSLPPSLDEDSRTTDSAMDAPTVNDLPHYEMLDGHQAMEQDIDSRPAEDATLANLFRSPIKYISTPSAASPEKVDYPTLPHSDNSQVDSHAGTPQKCEHVVEEAVAQDVLSAAVDAQSATIQSEATIDVERNEAEQTQSQNKSEGTETLAQIEYPVLPLENMEASTTADEGMEEDEDEDAELSEIEVGTGAVMTGDDSCSEQGTPSDSGANEPEEEFTEATLQLDIMRDYRAALQKDEPAPAPKTQEPEDEHDVESTEEEPKEDMEMSDAPDSISTQDITDGLTLSFAPAQPQSLDPKPRKLHSPPPPPRPESGPDDVTMTVAFDDDTAVLKDFLHRAAASKAEKAAIITHRRESLQNRRDSDVVRHALASPRKALEEKDPNSPSKLDNELTLDLSLTPALSMPAEPLPSPTPTPVEADEDAEEKNARSSRRSSRTKKSRLPAPASTGPAPAPKIAIRRADGNEVVVLKKDDAKVLADLTRTNTRKNKQGAFGVTLRLMKLMMEASSLPPIDDSTKELVVGKNVRWDEQLAYYQENPDTVANALADAESLATPDELAMGDAAPEPKKKKVKTSKESTPKVRRVRGLGSTNGTPGKALSAPSSLLPDAVFEENASTTATTAPGQQHQLPTPKPPKAKKMPVATSSFSSSSSAIDSALSSCSADSKLPALDIAPVGVSHTPHRKSRLAAPKKVVLPHAAAAAAAASAPGQGKENAKKAIPTPKVAPKVVVVANTAPPPPPPSTLGMEPGLPRRRGRKY